MKKPIAIASLFFIFIALISSVSSVKTFEILETEKISLAPKVEDPDADRLDYIFTAPLDEKGEWQTGYGDAGEYSAAITVSDGISEVREDILIIVKRKDEAPSIDSFEPAAGEIKIKEGEKIVFKVAASDLNNDELAYEWNLGNGTVEGKEMLFETGYNDAGNYIVSAVVSDGKLESAAEWKVEVEDIDLEGMFSSIKDVETAETEIAKIELPDFSKYGISLEISDPIGNDNSWKTDYDDAGNYEVTVKANGSGFEAEKKVNVKVLNRDRAPKIAGLRSVSLTENELLNLELKAEDADNDKASFSAINLPEGAEIVDNVIVWKPDFDFVKKEKPEDYVKDAFGLLSRKVDVNISAKTKSLEDSKTISIKIKDGNRPFVLEKVKDIEANEGEEIIVEPKYNDPDNDRVFFRYEGFLSNGRKKMGFEDAGEYMVKMTASDGHFEETRFFRVKINDVNREPEFFDLGDVKISEGEDLSMELNAMDADNDAIKYSTDRLPEGARLEGNVFSWKPGFETVHNATSKDIEIEFIADDGKGEARKKMKITVLDRNKAPEIKGFSGDIITLRDEPLLFWVDAVDIDGDELSYEWDFGFREIEGQKEHQRVFTSRGMKEVRVIVSDGKEKAEKVWNVKVV